jgi:hypothetical protein
MPSSSSFVSAEVLKAQMAAQKAAKDKARAEEDAKYEKEMMDAIAKAEVERIRRELAAQKLAEEERRKKESSSGKIVIKRAAPASVVRAGKRKAAAVEVEEEEEELFESSDIEAVRNLFSIRKC